MRQYTNEIKNKIFNYLKSRLKIKKSTKGWWRADCIYCGGKYTFGFHFHHSKAHCFKCGEKVTPVEAIQHMENVEQLRDVYKILNLQEEYDSYETYGDKFVPRQEFIELPDSFKLINTGTSILATGAKNYMVSRGFDLDRLASMGIGYCTKGFYCGYVIFPLYQRGKLVFFQGRRFIENNSKMKNPPEEEFGIGKTQVIFNYDALFMYRRIVLVESITNAITYGDNAIAILGKTLSTYQLFLILNSPCESVTIMLDLDAFEWAIGIAMQLANYKKVKLIKMPDDRDVNDIGRKEAKALVRKFHYSSYHELFRLKINHNHTASHLNN